MTEKVEVKKVNASTSFLSGYALCCRQQPSPNRNRYTVNLPRIVDPRKKVKTMKLKYDVFEMEARE